MLENEVWAEARKEKGTRQPIHSSTLVGAAKAGAGVDLQ